MRQITLNQARSEPNLRRPSSMRINPPLEGSLDWRMELVTSQGEEVRVIWSSLTELTLFSGDLMKPIN